MTKRTFFAAALMAGLVFTSCKDDEGTADLLPGTWNINTYTVGTENIFDIGSDPSTNFGLSFDYDANGDFNQNWDVEYIDGGTTYSYSYNFTGTWEDLDGQLRMTFDRAPLDGGGVEFYSAPSNYFAEEYNNYVETYNIVELTSSALNLGATINASAVVIQGTK